MLLSVDSMDEHELELLEHIAEQREALGLLKDAGEDEEIVSVRIKHSHVCKRSDVCKYSHMYHRIFDWHWSYLTCR